MVNLTMATGIASAIASMEQTSKRIRDIFWGLPAPETNPEFDEETIEYLEAQTHALYSELLITLEAFGLVEARRDLVRAWRLGPASSTRKIEYNHWHDAYSTKAFGLLSSSLDSLQCLVPRADEPESVTPGLVQLVDLLSRTAQILEIDGVEPTKEADVQRTMDRYLAALYGTDYCRQFSLPRVVRNFKPDAGIRSLSAVIEFKFADSRVQLEGCVGGLFEDSAGYRGSKDWTRFYSVIYQTGAFGTEKDLTAAFDMGDLVDWTPLLVTGKGARTTKKLATTTTTP
jgi:hypothetical protein